MPILAKEADIFPDNLLESEVSVGEWWAVYTRSRQEKQLMRRLRILELPHYSPIVTKRHRSPNGRMREVHMPLFPNYVFLRADGDGRYNAMTTNCISRCVPVVDTQALVTDLLQIKKLLEVGAPVLPEAKLTAGDEVLVKSGSFKGFRGTVVRRDGENRLVVAVRFMDQGASVKLEDCFLEKI